jgi:tRNA(adenine34) deaminase
MIEMDFIAPDISQIDLSIFMQEALMEADLAGQAGEVPIGSVLVIDGKIIARGRARHNSLRNQIRHAELNALLEGGERLWNDYKRAILVTSVEPCPLCLGAAVMADIPHIVFGLHDKNVCSTLTVETNPYVRRHIKSYYGGVLEHESVLLFEKYDPRSLQCILTASI